MAEEGGVVAKPSTEGPNPSGDVKVAAAAAVAKPSWFTPMRLLVIFCVINLINYVDRGAIASNGVNGSPGTCSKDGKCSSGTGIQGAFNLSNFDDGMLSSAFMVGLLIACPIFASLAKSFNPFRLIGVGLSVWTLAVVGSGFSFNFWSIIVCRMFVGVGEASFISLAAPFIDDNAPAAQKTRWLGIFYMCISVGYAIGYIYGGLVGDHFSWRYAFFGEGILMLPFAILGFCIKPLQLKGFAHLESKNVVTSVETVVSTVQGSSVDSCGISSVKEGHEDKSSDKFSRSKGSSISIFFKDMKALLREKIYVVSVLGYIAYTFVVGAYSYWLPKAGKSIYNMKDADMVFGGITIVCGMLGAIGGGFALDFINSTISNAFKLLSVVTFAGAILCFSALCFKSMYLFIAFFAIGVLLIFAAQGPVNYICLHSVHPSLRPLAMAMSTVAIHIFGDVPSAPLVGVLQDNLHNWRVTSLILSAILFPAAAIWFIGIFMHGVDRSEEDNELRVTPSDRSNGTSA